MRVAICATCLAPVEKFERAKPKMYEDPLPTRYFPPNPEVTCRPCGHSDPDGDGFVGYALDNPIFWP